jgi:competence protein ComEC
VEFRLRIEAGGKRILLTSDIEVRDEAAMLQRVTADVLLVPHHGSRTSSTPEFIAAVDAREAVIPVGCRNRFRHPKPSPFPPGVRNGAATGRSPRTPAATSWAVRVA